MILANKKLFFWFANLNNLLKWLLFVRKCRNELAFVFENCHIIWTKLKLYFALFFKHNFSKFFSCNPLALKSKKNILLQIIPAAKFWYIQLFTVVQCKNLWVKQRLGEQIVFSSPPKKHFFDRITTFLKSFCILIVQKINVIHWYYELTRWLTSWNFKKNEQNSIIFYQKNIFSKKKKKKIWWGAKFYFWTRFYIFSKKSSCCVNK